MSEDTLLIQQTLAGDEQAFHRLSAKYQSAIYSLILSYVRNPDDAQEIMQDVFLKAYQGLSSLRRSERFRFWLYQLARNQCQDWKRKNQAEFQQLTDKTADGAYPADELLILRETLAKIMQAIDELPETEKRILKERYLDDSSYAEMQAKHGLSYKALNMRLLRAKQKVRARLEKLLAGVGIFSWQDAVNKMLAGGVETVKISLKVKIITIGVVAVLVLGGTGVILWHYQQSTQNITSDSSINQTIQKASLPSANKQIPANSKIISDGNVSQLSEKQNTEEDITSEQMTASGINFPKTGDSKIDPKLAKKIEVYNGLMRLLPDYKQVTQSAENVSEEIRNQTNSDFLYDRNRFPEINEIRYGPDGIKVFDKQGKEIINNPEINGFVENIHKKEEEIKTLAVKIKSILQEIDDLCPREEFQGWTKENPPQRITGVVSWHIPNDDFRQPFGILDEYALAKWLGKELPWEGNTDYKNAKNFTP